MNIIPTVIEKSNNKEYAYDLYSRLLEDRIIFLCGEINDYTANIIISELLFLDNKNHEKIYIYINSPGGVITSGMAIYDTMQYIKCDVSTVCSGMAASMGAFLLAAGTKGKRFALPYSNIMIHQPLASGLSGQASDILIHAENLVKTKKTMNELLAKMTGKSIEQIEFDTDRDHFMTAAEAKDYGIVDEVVVNKK